MARLKSISDFLGLRRSTVGMLSMVILVGMGICVRTYAARNL